MRQSTSLKWPRINLERMEGTERKRTASCPQRKEARVVSVEPKHSTTRSPVWRQPKGKKRALEVENRSAKKGHEERKKEKTGQGWSSQAGKTVREETRERERKREARQKASGGDDRRSGTQRVSETGMEICQRRGGHRVAPSQATGYGVPGFVWAHRVASSARATRAVLWVCGPESGCIAATIAMIGKHGHP